MKIAAYFMLLFMLFPSVAAYAQDESGDIGMEELEALLAGEEEVKPYEYPKIRPTFMFSTGYRLVGNGGARSAIDYEYLEDSVPLLGEARVFRFPHRFYLILDWDNAKDYFAELRYAYGDTVFFRSINRMVFHNLSRVDLIDLGAPGSSPDVSVRDSGVEYGLKTAMNSYFLRIKPHAFPAHAYFNLWMVDKEGKDQDVSLLGSGFFNNMVRTSQERDIEWSLREYTVGANSHLGLVEADYRHTERKFEPKGDRVLYDSYSANAFRPAGTYPHDLIPDLEDSSNTIKFHTSYTGRLFGTATLYFKERENTYSGTKSDYFFGSGGLMWMPAMNLTFFAKYSHKEIDEDTPSTATIKDITNPANTFTFGVKPALDSSSDTVALTGRYRPARWLTLRGKYTHEDMERDNAALWGLRDNTKKDALNASADIRLPRSVDVDLKYTYTEVDDPSYNIEPDYSNAGAVSVSWMAASWVSTLLSFDFTKEKRGFLSFRSTAGARDRDVEQGRLLGSGIFTLRQNVFITASYAYIYNNIEQDLVYESLAGTPQIDRGTKYKDKTQSYVLDVSYVPTERITLQSGITYTENDGAFFPQSQDLSQPVSVAVFSDTEVDETAFSASGEYRTRGGYGIGLEYTYVDVAEAQENPYDDVEDGDVQIVMLMVSKRWK